MNCKYTILLVSLSFHSEYYVIRGHLEMLERIKQAEVHKPGLFLGGNYRTGVAFGDCVQFGGDIAETVGTYLKSGRNNQ
jgi:hypothetical protein